MLESLAHEQFSCWFVTLTYAPEHLPAGGTLVPRDLKGFIKALYKSSGSFRYYAVGEYGGETLRPHYHVILFGFKNVRLERHKGQLFFKSDEIGKAWEKGLIDIVSFNEYTAQYIAGYTIKKMTRHGDKRLGGRHPEFARMSLKPGIGGLSLGPIVEFVSSRQGAAEVARTNAIPSEIRMGRKKFPLGKYLRTRIATAAGYDPSKVVRVSKQSSELMAMENAFPETRGKKASKREAQNLRAESMARFTFQRRKIT